MKKFYVFTALLTLVYVTFVASNEHYSFKDAAKVVTSIRSDYDIMPAYLVGVQSVSGGEIPKGVGGSGYTSEKSLAVYISPDLFTCAVVLNLLLCCSMLLAQGFMIGIFNALIIFEKYVRKLLQKQESQVKEVFEASAPWVLALTLISTAALIWPVLYVAVLVVGLCMAFEWQRRGWLEPVLERVREFRHKLMQKLTQ